MSNSTIYTVRSSAARAAKKACRPEQEWVIQQVGGGFTYTILEVEEKQPTPSAAFDLGKPQVDEFDKVTEADHIAHRAENSQTALRNAQEAEIVARGELEMSPIHPNQVNRDKVSSPWKRAKIIVCDMHASGATKKQILDAGEAANIKRNTIDGAYYEMVVKGGHKS